MGLVGLAHVLWKRRIVVGVGVLLAVAVAVVGVQRGANVVSTASSSSKVLIDTPKSLVADARARGAATIYTRARLVGNLIADDEAKAVVARRAGVPLSQLAIAGPGAAAPPDAIAPLAQQAIIVAKPIAPYLISVEVEPNLPIVSITANAPNRKQAESLDRAAVETLSLVARGAPGGGSSVAIERLGKPLIAIKAAGGGKAKPVGGALVLLSLWCLGCVVFDGVSRRRKLRRAGWADGHGALG